MGSATGLFLSCHETKIRQPKIAVWINVDQCGSMWINVDEMGSMWMKNQTLIFNSRYF